MSFVHKTLTGAALAIGFGFSATSVFAQSTGVPFGNNPSNQYPAPGNSQPTNPSVQANPAARVPTAPEDRRLRADDLGPGGAATGAGAGTAPATRSDSPDNTPLSPSNSGGPRPGGGAGGGPSR